MTYILYYSEGPGTSRYEAAQGSRDHCEKMAERFSNSRAKWEIVEDFKTATTEDLKVDCCRYAEGGQDDDARILAIAMELQSRLGPNVYTNRVVLRQRDGKLTPWGM